MVGLAYWWSLATTPDHCGQNPELFNSTYLFPYLQDKKLLYIPEDIICKVLFGHEVHGLQSGNERPGLFLAPINMNYGTLHIPSGATGFKRGTMINGCGVFF